MTAKKNHEKNQNVKGLTYGFQQGVLALKSDYHPDGINLMMQEPSEGNSPKSSFMRHGLLGHYSEKTNDTRLPDQDKALSEALQTRMEVSSLVSGDYELASTGSILDLPGGGCITFSGRPYFRNSVLTDIANKNGPVAAIAHAYDSYSQDVFRHIYGAFCCAIIDNQAQRVLLGIDRLGQHSLYYDDGDDTLAFGSSASEALTWSNPDRGNTLHNQGIYNYLYFHMVPCPVSVYRGLKKLPAAHYIDFHDGQCDLVNYWLPDFSESTSAQSFETLSGQLMDVLRSAVQQSINGAGKVGCFLSGGLDSSTVTGVLADIREQQTEAYSIGFSAEGYDEMAFARITANHFGVDLKEYYVTPQDVVDTLPAIAGSYDEPFGNSSALPAYFCARMAADNGIDT